MLRFGTIIGKQGMGLSFFLLFVGGGCAAFSPQTASNAQSASYAKMLVGTWVDANGQGGATVRTNYNSDGTWTGSWTLHGLAAAFAPNGTCGGTRSSYGNWYTRISKITP